MALSKEVETKYGVILAYWRITEICIDNSTQKCRIIISPYINEDARNSGLLSLESEAKEIVAEDILYTGIENYKKYEVTDFSDYFSTKAISESHKNIYELAYLYIKERVEMFKDSVDV